MKKDYFMYNENKSLKNYNEKVLCTSTIFLIFGHHPLVCKVMHAHMHT